jgi:hypothetical protein
MKFNSSFCINIYTNFNKNALRHKFAKRKQKKNLLALLLEEFLLVKA